MDCWVAQLGVVTTSTRPSPRSVTPAHRCDGQGRAGGQRGAAQPRDLAVHHQHGEQRRAVATAAPSAPRPTTCARSSTCSSRRRARPGACEDKPIDVCIYAHGGLVGEDAAARDRRAVDAAAVRAQDLPDLPDVGDRLLHHGDEHASRTRSRTCRAPPASAASIERWWNQRLERLLATARHADLGRDEAERRLRSAAYKRRRARRRAGRRGAAVPPLQAPGRRTSRCACTSSATRRAASSRSFMIDRLVRGRADARVGELHGAGRARRDLRPARAAAPRQRRDQALPAVPPVRPRRGGRPHLRPLPALAAVSGERVVRRRYHDADPGHAEVLRSVCGQACRERRCTCRLRRAIRNARTCRLSPAARMAASTTIREPRRRSSGSSSGPSNRRSRPSCPCASETQRSRHVWSPYA